MYDVAALPDAAYSSFLAITRTNLPDAAHINTSAVSMLRNGDNVRETRRRLSRPVIDSEMAQWCARLRTHSHWIGFHG